MNEAPDFAQCFEQLTEHSPLPWQRRLYDECFSRGVTPSRLSIPTGLGKTSVIHIWLIALANGASRLPHRLVYVVNRRTIVDQATREAENLREKLASVGQMRERLQSLCALDVATPLAISTLRGQFADNGEWCADPSRPAIIIGTVDMIGSRLLFSGYGRGFKSRPLHAGFLGQDALLVHDEAHLEPAFQKLLDTIEQEQERCEDFGRLRVMAMTATSRGGETAFTLTDEDHRDEIVKKRIEALKTIAWHTLDDEKKTAEKVAECALERAEEHPHSAILVFVRKVDDVDKVVDWLTNKKKGNVDKKQIETLTGTIRGLERDELVETPVFRRFVPGHKRDNPGDPAEGTVYLVCTSAGEVGIDISADHLVCDLTPFDSMAQRFGRVNRFGNGEAVIDIVHPAEFDETDKNEYEARRKKTLDIMQRLNGDASPKALAELQERADLPCKVEDAFTPLPGILQATDILFDAWALTTIGKKLPGRPPVDPYLHGISEWQPPETKVAWREEVDVITGDFLEEYKPKDLLDNYPLKPHELLRDNSDRAFKQMKELAKRHGDAPVWIMDRDGVEAKTLLLIVQRTSDEIAAKTIILPPSVGGLKKGMLDGKADSADDVADEWVDENGNPRRARVWNDDPGLEDKTRTMRLVQRIDLTAGEDEDNDEEEVRSWSWYVRSWSADDDASRTSQRSVSWNDHTEQVVDNAKRIAAALQLPMAMQHAMTLAAKAHDLGKKRDMWQRSIGNHEYPQVALAKSDGKRGGFAHRYRHEFGSVLDVLDEPEFQNLSEDMQDVALHIIAAHHGRARPHFTVDESFDRKADSSRADDVARGVPRRFARLQRKYGRWGLAYLESLLRAADWAASADPIRTEDNS